MIQKEGASISFLEFLPVSLFGAIMGLTGLSFCWEWAEKTWGFYSWIKDILGMVAIVFFIVLALVYLIKIWEYPSLVKSEFQHPVTVSFFGTFIISLLLLPGIILHYSMQIAIVVWISGAVLMFLFAWMVLRRWLSHQQEQANALPAWIIPIIGTLDVPIVGYRLPIHGVHEICLCFFGIGLLFAIIFFTIIFTRLLFNPALPEAIQPTLMIMVGPFALAYSGYESFPGYQDTVAGVFYYFALFTFLLFGSKIFLLPKCCPFRVSWWGVSFPLVAITLASFRYAARKQSPAFQVIPGILITISTGIIIYLLLQTFYRFFTHKLFLNNPVAEKATQLLGPVIMKNASKELLRP